MSLKPFAALIFFAMFSCPLFAQTQNELFGNDLSVFVEKRIAANGFSFERETLAKTGADKFAFNIIADVAKSKKSTETSIFDEKKSKDTLILAFTQEDFFSHHEKIEEVLREIHSQRYDFSVKALFSVLDEGSDFSSGSEIFAKNFQEADTPQVHRRLRAALAF